MILQDALNLPKRPFAHNTTLIPVIVAALFAVVYLVPSLWENRFARLFPLMFFIATFSHHLRDADRRGLWLGPFFSTPAIPYKLYTFFIAVLPLSAIVPGLIPVTVKGLIQLIGQVVKRTKVPSDRIIQIA